MPVRLLPLALLIASAAHAQIATTTILKTGDPLPFLGDGFSVDSVIAPSVNSDGRFVAGIRVAGPGVTEDNALVYLSDRSGTLELIARSNDPLPDDPSESLVNLYFRANINDNGVIAYANVFEQRFGIPWDVAIWLDDGSSPARRIARDGDSVPGFPGVTFLGAIFEAEGPSLNNSNEIPFRTILDGPSIDTSNDSALFVFDGSALQLRVREGDAVGDGSTIAGDIDVSPAINARSEVAFGVATDDGSGPLFGAWVSRHSGLVRSTQQFDSYPDAGVGATIRAASTPIAINDAGEFPMWLSLENGPVTLDDNIAVSAGLPESQQLRFREGEPIPTLGFDVTATRGSLPPLPLPPTVTFSLAPTWSGLESVTRTIVPRSCCQAGQLTCSCVKETRSRNAPTRPLSTPKCSCSTSPAML